MNKQKRNEILKVYGTPAIETPNGSRLIFARQNVNNCNEIEKMTDEELIKEWKALVWMNNIYGQVSLNELQRISLIELEMDERKGIGQNQQQLDQLMQWYSEAKAKRKIDEEIEIKEWEEEQKNKEKDE